MSGKNSIQVAIKVRPLLIRKEKDQQYWRIVDNSIQLLDSQAEPYFFDHIFDQDATNQIIFDKMAKQIVHSAIQGFNGTIFAYGQTSSGKTYTMMGDDDNPGVMVLAAKEIFKEIERTQDRQFLLRVGYIEIYNEKIYDLLNKKNQDLKIHETSTGIVSLNCEEIIIRSEDDLLNHLNRGGKERTVGETNMNERSSRSHAIFRIIIESRKMDRSEDDAIIQSVINLVDLAGSERADQTGARGTRLIEGGHINKSLLFLSNVIKRLSENEDDKYISYRDSKLTRILQASLGGNTLTAIICNIKPNAVEETQSTLNFALRAKTIKNKPQVNEIVSDATMMKRLEHEIKVLKTRLEEEQRKNESQLKVRQLEQRIKDEDLKIISCNSLHSIRNREKRRRTWCPSSTNLDASSTSQQPSTLSVPGSHLVPQPSRLQAPKTYNTPLITMRIATEPPSASKLHGGLPIPPDNLPDIDEEFAPAELVNFEMISPIQSPSSQELQRPNSITPKLINCTQSTFRLAKVEHDFMELESFTSWENKIEVKYEPDMALKQRVENLSQRNAVLEKERLEYIQLKNEIDIASENLKETENRCDKLQAQLAKLTLSDKVANEKIVKYEAELAELKNANEKLEMENREAVNLEFEFKRHKNKSKLRENELLDALNDKEKEITKLEKSLNALNEKRFRNSKEELFQKSINVGDHTDEYGKICIKCEDLQRLLEENKRNTLEFEKLTLEFEELKLDYAEIEKENETNKLKIVHLEELQEKEKAECEKLLVDIQQLREKLENVQRDYEELTTENFSKREECAALNKELEVAKKEMVVLEENFTKLELSWQKQQQTINDIEAQYTTIHRKYEQLQHQYEQLESTRGQSLTDYQRLEKENIDLQTEIKDLKNKVHDAQQNLLESNAKCKESATENKTAKEEYSTKTTNVHQENELHKKQLLEIQTQFEDLQKEYDDLSNQLMDNLQDSEYLKKENTELKEKLKEHEKKEQEITKTEDELNELKSQLQKVLSSESEKMLKNPLSCINSSMRSTGLSLEEAEDFVDSPQSQDLLCNFCELSESLIEIELEYSKGKSKVFKSVSQNSTPTSYKMYLKNILGVRKAQKQFDTEIENIHLQGSFKQHSFHIVEFSGEDKSYEMEYNEIDTNGCESMREYIEKLKQEITELKASNEQERLRNKSLLESTEQAFKEMKEQITQLSAELLEKSMFVENCACNTYKQQIENLEREKADMTVLCAEFEDKVNTTLNASSNELLNNTVQGVEVKAVVDDKLKELEQIKLRELELLESYDSQTKTLEEMAQRCIDMETDLETVRAQLKDQEKEFKEKYNQLQLENLQKLEISASEYRENMKKYNKEWEERRDEYEMAIKELLNRIDILIQAATKAENGKMEKRESICDSEETVDEEETLDVQPKTPTATEHQETFLSDDMETIKQEKCRLEEDKVSLQQQLNIAEETLKQLREENRTQCEELALLDAKIISLEEHLEDLKIVHVSLSRDNSALKTEIDDIKEDLNCIPELHDKNQKLSDEMETLNCEYSQLCVKLQKAESQIQELCKEDKNREELIQTLQNKLTHLPILEEEIKSLAKDFEDLKLEHTQVQDKLHKTEAQIQDSCSEDASRTVVNVSLSRDNSALKSEIDDIKEDLNCIPELHDKNQKLYDEIETLNCEYSQLYVKLQKAESQIQEFCKEDTKREELIQTLQNKLTHLTVLEEEKKGLAKDFADLKLEYTQVQDKLHKAEAQIQDFCSEDASREKLVQTLQAKLCSMTAVEEEKKHLEIESMQLRETVNIFLEKDTNISKEVENLRQEVLILQLEKTELEVKLRQINSKYNLLKTDKFLLDTKLSELTEERQLFYDKCSALQEEKIKLAEDLKCLKEKEKSEDLLEQIINERNELEKKINLNTDILEIVQNQLEEKQNALSQVIEEKLQLQQDLQSLKESLSKNMDEKRKQLEETEREKEETEQDKAKLCEDLLAIKQSLTKAIEENQKQEQKMEQCKQDNCQLKKELMELEQGKQEYQLNLEKVKQEQNNLQQDLKTLKETLSNNTKEKQQVINDLENDYQKARKHKHKLQNELEHITADLVNFKEDEQEMLKENAQLKTELRTTKESLTKLQEELQHVQEKLIHYEKLQEDKNNLEATLNTLKEFQSGTLSSLKAEKDRLHNTIQQYEQKEAEVKEREETLKQKIESLYQQLHEMRGKVHAYEKISLEHEEAESVLKTMAAENQKLQEEISQLTSQQENHVSKIENLSSEIKELSFELVRRSDEKKILESTLSHMKDMVQGEKYALQKENQELKSSLEEFKLKHDSLQLTNAELETLNKQMEQQLNSAKEKLVEYNSVQEELKMHKVQHRELQLSLKKTVDEAEHCSLALREDIERHKHLLQKQLESYNSLKLKMETKEHSLSEENLKLSANIETLQKEKLSLEEKLREIAVRNFEQDLQRHVTIDATANNISTDSNSSNSPRGRKSFERINEEKLIQQKNSTTAERKNRRLSTHDERRRQSYWGAVHDKETMTDPLDTNCNCMELDRKLKDCERNLFIKNSQVTALSMELKNHPLKEENAILKKRLQEEQEKHRIEIKRYKNKLNEQNIKTEKAFAAAALATAKSDHAVANAALAAEQQVIPKIVADVEVQTDDDVSRSLQKLQGKYNDLKNICRFRYNVIKELEEKVSQKENSDGNSPATLETAPLKLLELQSQCELLKKELNTLKDKYESAKKVLHSRREEIVKLRAQLEKTQ